MKKKEVIVIAIVLLLIGCANKTDFVRILTLDNEKSYWVEQKRITNNHFAYENIQWIFYPNKSAKCFLSFNPKKKGTPMIINIEGPSDYGWSFNSRDSVLDLGPGVKYKMIRYNIDTISMKTEDGKYILLIRERNR